MLRVNTKTTIMHFSKTSLLLLMLFTLPFACTKDSLGDPVEEMEMEEEEETNQEVDGVIWTGAEISFSKTDGASPSMEANQDRITDNVWITRGNNGGQIFNAKTENIANKSNSPDGTEWAIGSIESVNSLEFKPFRTAVGKPSGVVGQDLVVHLIADDIYLSVKFTSWSESKGGGFAYTRATEN